MREGFEQSSENQVEENGGFAPGKLKQFGEKNYYSIDQPQTVSEGSEPQKFGQIKGQGQQTEVTEGSEPREFGQIIKGGKIYRGQLQPRKMGVLEEERLSEQGSYEPREFEQQNRVLNFTPAQISELEIIKQEMIENAKEKRLSNCHDSLYGCCADGVTPKSVDGTCTVPIKNCLNTPYGCCPDGVTIKNSDGSNCSSCAKSPYGCCPDGTNKSADGSNCKPACTNSQYGCCDDGVTTRTSTGCPKPTPAPTPSCAGSPYGCCPDNVTVKNATGSNCASYPPNVYIIPIKIPDSETSETSQTSNTQYQTPTSYQPPSSYQTNYQPNTQTQPYYQSQPTNYSPSTPSPELFNKPVQSLGN
jgi:hypothetical protein